MTINLTTATVATVTGPSPLSENDAQAGCTLLDVDYNGQIATFTFKQGTASGQALNAGAYLGLSTVTIQVNLQTGVWSSFDDKNPLNNKAGTFTGAAFTTFVNMMKNLRNTVESFVAGTSGILPGTQVSWP